MDEQLPVISDLWDPEVARQVRSLIQENTEEKADIPRDRFLHDIAKTYRDLGGQTRLAYEMNLSPLFFYKNFLKFLLPQEKLGSLDLTVTIKTALPPSPLDGDCYENDTGEPSPSLLTSSETSDFPAASAA
jgi:hypothetical protein